MSITPSNMLPLGTIAPDFTLLDTVSGESKSLHALASDNATVILFICNHCPFVVHLQDEIVALANAYRERGVSFIAISSNDVKTYPQDGPDEMAAHAKKHAYPFPYLYDETQEVAKAYQAACTPDFYIFDAGLKCVYRGQFDASRPGNDVPITGADLSGALDLALEGKSIPDQEQTPSQGCNIKWIADNECSR